MTVVAVTALGVGGATVLGAILGFLIKNIPHRYNDALLGFASGIMLAASFSGLITPSLESGNVWITVLGIFLGAGCLHLLDRFTPHLHKLSGVEPESHADSNIAKVMLFVMAIAIHNLPEGIAAGVGFGSGDHGAALTVAIGIALQNIPEGMVVISPLLLAGVSPRRTFLLALGTGMVEVFGTFLGYFAVSVSQAILPFALAFAGGTMLYVISDEMIPETHADGHERLATYSLLTGVCVMLITDTLMG